MKRRSFGRSLPIILSLVCEARKLTILRTRNEERERRKERATAKELDLPERAQRVMRKSKQLLKQREAQLRKLDRFLQGTSGRSR